MEFRNQVVQILLRTELGVELADVLHPVAVVGVAVRCPWALIVFVDGTNPDYERRAKSTAKVKRMGVRTGCEPHFLYVIEVVADSAGSASD